MHERDHNCSNTLIHREPDVILVVRPPGACIVSIPSGHDLLDIDLSKSRGQFASEVMEYHPGPGGYVYLDAGLCNEIRITRPGWSVQLAKRPLPLSQPSHEAHAAGSASPAPLSGHDETIAILAHQLAGVWVQSRRSPDRRLCQAVATLLAARVDALRTQLEASVIGPYPVSSRVREAVAVIEGDLSRANSLEELASAVGLSPYHFARTFRAETGRSPHQFLLEKRVERAKWLLRHSDEPIAAIAHDCGFGSQSHMTDVFRRMVGKSPGQVRRLV